MRNLLAAAFALVIPIAVLASGEQTAKRRRFGVLLASLLPFFSAGLVSVHRARASTGAGFRLPGCDCELVGRWLPNLHCSPRLASRYGELGGRYWLRQFAQDAALFGASAFGTHFPQGSELLLKCAQFLDTHRDLLDVCLKNTVDLTAILGWHVLEAQQHTNLVERHVQRTTAANEKQAFDVRVAI